MRNGMSKKLSNITPEFRSEMFEFVHVVSLEDILPSNV